MVLKICVTFSLLIGIACIHVLAFPKLDEDLKVNKDTPQVIEDELIIARQILERVPLIDGFVLSFCRILHLKSIFTI